MKHSRAAQQESIAASTVGLPDESKHLYTVLQPIIDMHSGVVVGCEALTRFADESVSLPARFAQADASGEGPELEAACLRAALGRRADLPDRAWLAVNVSPAALSHPDVQQALAGDLDGVVVEITERHGPAFADLERSLTPLRARGALVAVDDATIGCAGVPQLRRLRPDLVKLDSGLVTDPADWVEQSAVIEALVSKSRRIGARVIGEGVETIDDLRALAALDVDYAQGWVIARPALYPPAPDQEAVTACRAARRALLRTPTATQQRATGHPAPDSTALHRMTTALAPGTTVADLTATLRGAATGRGVDLAGVSVLADGHLRQIAVSGTAPDPTPHPLSRFPASRTALQTASMVEIHVDDPNSDSAEREVLSARQLASVLIVPLIGSGTPLGILAFAHRTPHRWTGEDIRHAQAVADRITVALRRTDQQPDARA